jgi:hypothetical protein
MTLFQWILFISTTLLDKLPGADLQERCKTAVELYEQNVSQGDCQGHCQLGIDCDSLAYISVRVEGRKRINQHRK